MRSICWIRQPLSPYESIRHTEHDILLPAEAAHKMHKHVSGPVFFEVANAGHSVFFERPDVFNSIVLEFLQSVVSD